jgi:hypothetical protein
MVPKNNEDAIFKRAKIPPKYAVASTDCVSRKTQKVRVNQTNELVIEATKVLASNK